MDITESRSLGAKIESLVGKNLAGIVLLIVGGVAALYAGKEILEFIMELLHDALYAVWYGIGLFLTLSFIFWLVTSDAVRMATHNFVKSLDRKIIDLMVTVDPLGNMKTYRDDIQNVHIPMLKKNLTEFGGYVNGVRRQIADLINKAKGSFDKAEYFKEQAERYENNSDEYRQNMTDSDDNCEAGADYKKSAETLQPMLEQVEQEEKFFQGLLEVANYCLKKLNRQIEIKESEYNTIMAGQKIMKASKKALGNSKEYQMFQASSEHISKQFDQLISDMKMLMNDSKSIFTDMKAEKGANVMSGREMLATLEARKNALRNNIDMVSDRAQLPQHAQGVVNVPTTSVSSQKVSVNNKKSLF